MLMCQCRTLFNKTMDSKKKQRFVFDREKVDFFMSSICILPFFADRGASFSSPSSLLKSDQILRSSTISSYFVAIWK